MKVAVIKLGSRIAINSAGTSGGTGEALSIIKMLVDGGAYVDVFTKVLDSDDKPDNFSIYNIEDNYKNISNYDALVVLNGNINYFGGVDDHSQTLNYYIINHFPNKVFYILCDCNLLLKQAWPTIEKKSWSSNYKKEDIYITRDDIIYVSQASATLKVIEKAKQQGVNIKNVVHYPFEKFPLITLKDCHFNENPKYDLLYGGTFRGGKREADMIKFYFGYSNNISVEMFGKIELNDFNSKKIVGLRPPGFGKSVPYNKFDEKMLEAKATVIIGDPLYKAWSDLAQRIYESIRVGNVTFIDSSYDFKKSVYRSRELRDFCYVSSRDDVESKLKLLNDNSFRKHIVDLQRSDVAIDSASFCSDFVSLLYR